MSTNPASDPDFDILTESSAAISTRYTNDGAAWVGSPFEWILRLPSRSKGAVGELLVEQWAVRRGMKVRRSVSSDADRVIDGHRVEIKMSTLWKSGGFKFQQIRDQSYDYCLCLGLSPHQANAWLLPKSVLRRHVIGHMGQHTGAAGADTAWLGFQADAPYPWMAPFGDRLADVAHLFDRAGPGEH